MKLLFRAFASIYQMFNASSRTNDIPYFRTLATIIGLLMLHLFQLTLIFNLKSDYFMPWKNGDSKDLMYLKGMGSIFFLAGILSLLFRRKKIEAIYVSEVQIRRTRTIIIWYFIASMIGLFALLLQKKGIH